jgi:hypothetical protein
VSSASRWRPSRGRGAASRASTGSRSCRFRGPADLNHQRGSEPRLRPSVRWRGDGMRQPRHFSGPFALFPPRMTVPSPGTPLSVKSQAIRPTRDWRTDGVGFDAAWQVLRGRPHRFAVDSRDHVIVDLEGTTDPGGCWPQPLPHILDSWRIS